MKPVDDFALHCCELLASIGRCTARRMFGGWGLSVDGLNVGLIIAETLYLKVSPGAPEPWLAAGGRPFIYEAKGKPVNLGYCSAPDNAMESPALMAPWARLAMGNALAARALKERPKAQPAKPTRPRSKRITASAAKPSARRKSAKG
jgi:DNA transformation protein